MANPANTSALKSLSPRGRATRILSSCLLTVKTIIRLRPIKFALLIGINYPKFKTWELEGPQCDVELVQGLLIERYGFKKANILVLSDKKGMEADKLPTYENIKREVGQFIRPNLNAHYFFLFSGHSGNRPDSEVPSKESDNKEEYIIPCDALKDEIGQPDAISDELTIADKFLHDKLVKPLQPSKGSHLLAILDCCHSGTLLNLEHRRCHQEGSVKGKIKNIFCRALVEPLYQRLVQPSLGEYFSLIGRSISLRPQGMECLGLCPRKGKAKVVCISACKDSQTTIDRPTGGTIVKTFVDLMKGSQRPQTYRKLMEDLRQGSHQAILATLQESKRPPTYIERIKLERQVKADPQLSSLEAFNLDSKIII